MNAQLAALIARDIVLMLASVCPHMAEELWHTALYPQLDEGVSVYDAAWPSFDVSRVQHTTVDMAVQVQGKVRAHIQVEKDATSEQIQAAALEAVSAQLAGKTVRKVIVIANKLVNIVAS